MYNAPVLLNFLFGILSISAGENHALGKDLEICPDYSKAVSLAYDEFKTAVPNILGIATLDVRVPENGILPGPLTCVLILDQAHDGTGGEVTITNGGVGSNFINIRITSQVWRGLDYRIQAFTGTNKTSESTSSSAPASSTSLPDPITKISQPQNTI